MSDPERNLNGDQFGLSSREQAAISGRALGGHIWDQITDLFGGEESMRQDFVNEAWLRADNLGYPIQHLHEEGDLSEGGDSHPVFVHRDQDRGLEFRAHPGGPYIDVHSLGEDSPFDVIHQGDKDQRTYKNIMNSISEYGLEEE